MYKCKQILFTAMISCFSYAGFAQTAANTGASQTANLELANALTVEILSSSATMSFNGINDLLNGVESGSQDIRVKSNKSFNVTAAASANNFTYTGSGTLNNILAVATALKVRVISNSTGGYVPWYMYWFGYQTINGTTPLPILYSCDPGGNQVFSVRYKATPGLNVVGGNYSTDIIYTATQI